MIDKFATTIGEVSSEFLDRTRTSKAVLRVSPVMPTLARTIAAGSGELRHRDTHAMIDKFATTIGEVSSEFLDRTRTSKAVLRVSPVMPTPTFGGRNEPWRTSASGR